MSGFTLEGEEYFIEYEGLHLLCTHCGVYGHRKECCPEKELQKVPDREVEIDGNGGKMERGEQSGLGVDRSEKWTVVQKARRQRKPKDKQGDMVRMLNVGSRYGVLADVSEMGTDKGEETNEHFVAGGVVKKWEDQRSNKVRQQKEKKGSGAKNDRKGASSTVEGNINIGSGANPMQNKTRKTEKRVRVDSSGEHENVILSGNEGTLMITMGEDHEVEGVTFGKCEAHKPHNLTSHLMPIDPRDVNIEEVEIDSTHYGPQPLDPNQSVEIPDELLSGTVVPKTQMDTGL